METLDIGTDDAVFASPTVVDDTIAAVDRYLRKPSGTADQGHAGEDD